MEKDNQILTADCEPRLKGWLGQAVTPFNVSNQEADFKAHNPVKKSVENRQSNPIFKKLINLVHSELTKNKKDYKSFSKFKPKDLI